MADIRVINKWDRKIPLPNGISLSPGQSCTLTDEEQEHPVINAWIQDGRLVDEAKVNADKTAKTEAVKASNQRAKKSAEKTARATKERAADAKKADEKAEAERKG